MMQIAYSEASRGGSFNEQDSCHHGTRVDARVGDLADSTFRTAEEWREPALARAAPAEAGSVVWNRWSQPVGCRLQGHSVRRAARRCRPLASARASRGLVRCAQGGRVFAELHSV